MQVLRRLTGILSLGIAVPLGSPSTLDARLIKKLKDPVQRAAAPDHTIEGKQQNRRVELVRIQ